VGEFRKEQKFKGGVVPGRGKKSKKKHFTSHFFNCTADGVLIGHEKRSFMF